MPLINGISPSHPVELQHVVDDISIDSSWRSDGGHLRRDEGAAQEPLNDAVLALDFALQFPSCVCVCVCVIRIYNVYLVLRIVQRRGQTGVHTHNTAQNRPGRERPIQLKCINWWDCEEFSAISPFPPKTWTNSTQYCIDPLTRN